MDGGMFNGLEGLGKTLVRGVVTLVVVAFALGGLLSFIVLRGCLPTSVPDSVRQPAPQVEPRPVPSRSSLP